MEQDLLTLIPVGIAGQVLQSAAGSPYLEDVRND
jgi:hypothetical protein